MVAQGRLKRFYRHAAVGEAEGGGFTVLLDGRPVRTPGRRAVTVPRRAAAEAMAEEWEAQGEHIDLAAMPVSRLVNTGLDLIPARRPAVLSELCEYLRTDVLCYRAEDPPDLAARQEALWQPLLDWAALRYGARLAVTRGVVYVEQPEESVAACLAAVEALDDLRLAGLQGAVQSAGSLVLGLALLEGRLGPDDTFAAAELDESWQIESWGEDPEQTARRERIRRDLCAAARLMAALAGEDKGQEG